MDISFATCDVDTALSRIQSMYKDKTITKENIPKLLELIKKDCLRVEDPMMHSTPRIIESRNIGECTGNEVEEAILEFRSIVEIV